MRWIDSTGACSIMQPTIQSVHSRFESFSWPQLDWRGKLERSVSCRPTEQHWWAMEQEVPGLSSSLDRTGHAHSLISVHSSGFLHFCVNIQGVQLQCAFVQVPRFLYVHGPRIVSTLFTVNIVSTLSTLYLQFAVLFVCVAIFLLVSAYTDYNNGAHVFVSR